MLPKNVKGQSGLNEKYQTLTKTKYNLKEILVSVAQHTKHIHSFPKYFNLFLQYSLKN